jgi:hypothetical protein
VSNNRYLVRLGAAATLVGAVVFFVSGLLLRPTASDPNENLLAAFEAWARCGNG